MDKIHSGTQNAVLKCLFVFNHFFKMNFPFPFDVTDQHALADLMVYIVYHLCVCTETPVKVSSQCEVAIYRGILSVFCTLCAFQYYLSLLQ